MHYGPKTSEAEKHKALQKLIQNVLKHKISAQKRAHRKESQKDSTPFGPRSFASAVKHGCAKTVLVNGKSYEVISGKTNFSRLKKPIASVGTDREIILLDPTSKTLNDIYVDFKTLVALTVNRDGNGFYNEREVLNRLNAYTQMLLPYKQDIIEHLAFDPDYKKQRGKINGMMHDCVSLDNIIENQRGVCRHHGLFNAFVLGKLVQDKYLPKADIRQYRNNVKSETIEGAHTVTVLIKGFDVWYLDSLNAKECIKIMGDHRTQQDLFNIMKCQNTLDNNYITEAASRFVPELREHKRKRQSAKRKAI